MVINLFMLDISNYINWFFKAFIFIIQWHHIFMLFWHAYSPICVLLGLLDSDDLNSKKNDIFAWYNETDGTPNQGDMIGEEVLLVLAVMYYQMTKLILDGVLNTPFETQGTYVS